MMRPALDMMNPVLAQLRFEAREKLSRIRPANIGQAGRVSGITPADLAVLLLYLG